MKTFLKFTALALSTAMMINCSSAVVDKSTTVAAAETAQGYVKPGASVKLRHDFSGKLNAGQVGAMSMDLIMPPTDGKVSISFSSSDGLDILSGKSGSDAQLQKAAFTNEAAPMAPQQLQFRALEDGVYYINAFIDVTHEQGQKRSRVITIPVKVGTGTLKPVNNGVSVDDSSGRSIAIMSADETVNP
ncbi:MAG: hypothetical protein ABJ275_07260 [Maricaulaceae bacterium]